MSHKKVMVFFFQAEDGIRDLVRSRGLGDVYKRQVCYWSSTTDRNENMKFIQCFGKSDNYYYKSGEVRSSRIDNCLLYTSDAADERSSVDLGGRRIIKKKKNVKL